MASARGRGSGLAGWRLGLQHLKGHGDLVIRLIAGRIRILTELYGMIHILTKSLCLSKCRDHVTARVLR